MSSDALDAREAAADCGDKHAPHGGPGGGASSTPAPRPVLGSFLWARPASRVPPVAAESCRASYSLARAAATSRFAT